MAQGQLDAGSAAVYPCQPFRYVYSYCLAVRLATPTWVLMGRQPSLSSGVCSRAILADAPGYVEFLVKRYPGGKSSSHLHALTPGDKLLFVAAIKGYPWKPNSYPHITLIAGGAGITPIFQLAQGILRNPGDRTAMTLIFGVNSDRDVLLREEFERWEKNFPGRFKAVYTVSHPDEDSPYNKGYVTKELLQTVSRRVDGQPTKVFVCGPPAMEQALTGRGGILQQLGYKREEIHRF